MGLRFRKSVKIAPGVKVNFNKNSVSTTLGTKGAHHTISFSGKRTTSVGIPGTGISYSETSGSTKKTTSKRRSQSKNSKTGNAGMGCLGIFLGILAIGLALALYTFAWIPALGVMIYAALSKKFDKKQKIKLIGISAAVFISSLVLASTIPEENEVAELISLEISLEETEFDIKDTVEVTLNTEPADVQIESLIISDNDIVNLDYIDGKAIISFISEGEATFHFIANDSVKSNSLGVTVTDSSIVDDGDTQEIDKTLPSDDQQDSSSIDDSSSSPADTPSGDSSQGSNIILPIVPGNSGSTDTPDEPDTSVDSGNSGNSDSSNDSGSTPVVPSTPEQNTYTYVLNTNTKKFHYSSCSSVKTIKEHNYGTFEGTRDEVMAQGYEPCGRCHP